LEDWGLVEVRDWSRDSEAVCGVGVLGERRERKKNKKA
jgi:hypothetical protein